LPTEFIQRTLPKDDAEAAKFFDPNRIPHVSSGCARLYDAFLDADLPRAFAISVDGHCGFANGEDPTRRALDFCRRNAKEPCKLYALDEKFVVD